MLIKRQTLCHNHDNKIKSKENSKITNKLIRNEKMTKNEALQAKKQLKNNSLPPALSTRSNDRKLRSNNNIYNYFLNKCIYIMSKTLWHKIKLEVPKEMVNITKNNKVVVKKQSLKQIISANK
jgi:hypothetical protein